MAKVTSNLEVAIPKELAEQVGIRPGDEVEWSQEANALRLAPRRRPLTNEERLALFRESVQRQEEREKGRDIPVTNERGWTREELYRRGGSR